MTWFVSNIEMKINNKSCLDEQSQFLNKQIECYFLRQFWLKNWIFQVKWKKKRSSYPFFFWMAEKFHDEWISQSNFHHCMFVFPWRRHWRGKKKKAPLLFRDAKMSKGNKVVLKSPEMPAFWFQILRWAIFCSER